MGDLEFLFAVLLVAAVLVRVADLIRVPYPIVLVLLGVGVGFAPSLPDISVEPEIVLLVFLPPLLAHAGFYSSPQELRVELRSLTFLAVFLVAATMGSVALLAHTLIAGLSWPAAFVLGAVVAPTDPVAATATFKRMGVPTRVALLVESESMINDATALVFFRTAVAALVAGSFSLGHAGLELIGAAIGGAAIGLVGGFVLVTMLRRLEDRTVSILLTLLFPWGAYVVAEKAEVSGVLAVVVLGVWLGWNQQTAFDADTRLQSRAFWETLVFALEALLFVLLGLQLPLVYDDRSIDIGELVGSAVAISLLVIAVRMAAQFVPFIQPGAEWRERVAIGWSGMRGAISLAAALSVPVAAHGRPEIVFVTTIVILVTLVGQGLTLPLVLRLLRLRTAPGWTADEAVARLETAQAALDRLDELEDEGYNSGHLQRLRDLYEARFRACQAILEGEGTERVPEDDPLRRYSALRRDLIAVERDALYALRSDQRMGQDVLRAVERDLDLEEARLRG